MFYLFHLLKGKILLSLFAIEGFTFNELYFITHGFWKSNTKAKQSVEASELFICCFVFGFVWVFFNGI